MNFLSKRFLHLAAGSLLFLVFLLGAAACSASATEGETNESTEMEHEMEEEMEHEADEEGGHEAARVPNNGAVIRIVTPTEGSTFKAGAEILVEVAVENFTLDEDGSHWHVFVDGTSYGMVFGQNTDQVLRGLALEPGEHEIEVRLALGTHEDLEDGDTVTILVEE